MQACAADGTIAARVEDQAVEDQPSGDIGLPRGDIPLALLAFNVGVELGELAFIGVVLGVVSVVKRLEFTASIQHRVLHAAPFGIGALAAFWFFDRLAGFLT
jgi:hypothetical protein